MAIAYPQVFFKVNLQVIYSRVTIRFTSEMDKYEIRQLALKALATRLGRGGIAHIAGKIGKEPNYVSRMLYPADKKGKKRIGEDSVELLNAKFPGWLELNPPPVRRSKPTQAAFTQDEETLLEGFRHADPGDRDTMLYLARRATEVFTERAGKK